MINKEAYDMYSVQTMTEYYEGQGTIFMIYVTLFSYTTYVGLCTHDRKKTRKKGTFLLV